MALPAQDSDNPQSGQVISAATDQHEIATENATIVQVAADETAASNEVTRAQGAEGTEQTRATTAEGNEVTARNSAITAAVGASGALTSTAIQTTGTFVAAAGQLVLADASTSTVAVTLPASPTAGAQVDVVRLDNSWTTANAVTVTGTGVANVLQPAMRYSYVYQGGVWQIRAPHAIGTLLPQPMKNADPIVDTTGDRRALTRIRHSYRQQIATFYGLSSFSRTSLPNTTVTADPDPYDPNGSVLITATSVGGATTTPTLQRDLDAVVDMSNVAIRLPIKLDNQNNPLGITLQLSSDGFTSANWTNFMITPTGVNANWIPPSFWTITGGGKSLYTPIGTGADLTQINSVRITMSVTSSQVVNLSLAWLEIVPNLSTKAKCVLSFDDGYTSHYTTALPLLMKYGFRATLFPCIAQVDAMPPETLRRFQEHGWQVGTHAYTIPEHSNLAGIQLREVLQKSLAANQGLGLWGGQDGAWWGGLAVTADTMVAFKQVFRTARWNTAGSLVPETLPPVNPFLTQAWLIGTDTGASLIAYAQKAIAQNGLCQFTYHNTAAIPQNLIDFLAWLDQNRDIIDVVTLDEALAPWTDVAPLPTPTWSKPAAPTVATQGLQTGVNVSWTVPASNGAPITGYTISRGATAGALTDIGTVFSALSTTPLMWKDTTAAAATTYFYAVRARNLAGDGSASAAVSGARASGRPTTPTTTVQPNGWWRIDQVTGVAAGAAILSVPDNSGNAHAMAKNTSYAAPTLLAAALGTYGAAHLTNAVPAALYAVNTTLTGENATVLSVLRSTTVLTSNQNLIGSGGVNFTNGNDFYQRFNGSNGRVETGPARTPANYGSQRYPVGGAWHVLGASIDTAANNHQVTNSVDGVAQKTTPPTAYTARAADGNVIVGMFAQGDAAPDMDWTEVIVFPSILADADRKTWEAYLGATYDLPVYAF